MLKPNNDCQSNGGLSIAGLVLIPRIGAPWIIAAHRFIQVSIAILVAFAVVVTWEEQRLAYHTDAK
jgi:hypothetical protein